MPALVITPATASREKVLIASRLAGGGACLLPLAGLFLPLPMAWLIAAIILGSVVHAFDLPAGRAVLGDQTALEDLDQVVTLNNTGSHFAALAGPRSPSSAGAGAGSGTDVIRRPCQQDPGCRKEG